MKQHPYYYRLRRFSRTFSILSTMFILCGKNKGFAQKYKELISDVEKAILKHGLAVRFYQQKDLLKDE